MDGSMYSDLRACTTARVKGVFCAGCVASDAIPLAGDGEVGAETGRGNNPEEQALAEVGMSLVLRITTAGERLLVKGEAGPAIAIARRRTEGGLARRSRVMREEVIGS
jgi:hypothetical protein